MLVTYRGYHPNPTELLEELSSNPPGIIAIDVETVSLKDRTPVGFAVATSKDDAFYFNLMEGFNPHIPYHVLINPRITKVYHNAIFDMLVMLEHNLPVEMSNFQDTYVYARHNNLPMDLPSLSTMYGELSALRWDDIIAEYNLKTGWTTLDIPQELLAKKCCIDAMATYSLYWRLKLRTVNQGNIDIEQKVIPILVRMSQRGIRLDQERLQQYNVLLEREVTALKLECMGQGFNPGSPRQVAYTLSELGYYLPMTKSRKSLSTSEEVLEYIDHPTARIALDYRKKSKLLGTYIRPWLGSERAYSKFHGNAVTGRISSYDRNLQNIPRSDDSGNGVRNIMLPDTEGFTDYDVSQQELRILEHMSGDKDMHRIFSKPTIKGDPRSDIHQFFADASGLERTITKNVNYSITYGATADTVQKTGKFKSLQEAKDVLALWARTFPGAWSWLKEQEKRGISTGYVTTLYGRKIKLPVDESENRLASKAVDYPMQGSGAELMQRQLILLDSLGYDIVVQMYDSMLIDGSRELPKEQLEHISPIWTPIEIKYGLERWE